VYVTTVIAFPPSGLLDLLYNSELAGFPSGRAARKIAGIKVGACDFICAEMCCGVSSAPPRAADGK